MKEPERREADGGGGKMDRSDGEQDVAPDGRSKERESPPVDNKPHYSQHGKGGRRIFPSYDPFISKCSDALPWIGALSSLCLGVRRATYAGTTTLYRSSR
jgi:hypothetical protein